VGVPRKYCWTTGISKASKLPRLTNMVKELAERQDSQNGGEDQQPRLSRPAARSLVVFCVVAGLLAVAGRILFRTHLPLTWDSVQFVLGVVDYDIVVHEPHPPGYFLYIHTAKLLGVVGLPPYLALVAMSLGAGGLTVGLAAWWAGWVWGLRGGLVAASLTLFSPLAWLYATRGDTYAISGFFALLVGYLCWRMLADSEQSVWPAAVAMGLAGGFRPTDALFLAPLWLWAMRRRSWRQAAVAMVIFGLITCAWVLPMLAATGGVARYREVSEHMSRMVIDQAPLSGNMRMLGVFGWYLISSAAGLLLAAWPLVLLAGREYLPRVMGDRRAWLFFAIWSVPVVIFCLLVHLGQAGYLLIVLGPAVLLATAAVIHLSNSLSFTQFVFLLLVIVVLNSAFTGSVLIGYNQQLERSLTGIQQLLAGFSGEDTLVLTGLGVRGESQAKHPMLNFRLAMYLAPHLPLYIFPLEWPRLYGGDTPGCAHQMEAGQVKPPIVYHGIRNLVLLDPRLQGYLPPATPRKRIWDDGLVQIYLVPLAPDAPLRLGPDGRLVLTAASAGDSAQ